MEDHIDNLRRQFSGFAASLREEGRPIEASLSEAWFGRLLDAFRLGGLAASDPNARAEFERVCGEINELHTWIVDSPPAAIAHEIRNQVTGECVEALLSAGHTKDALWLDREPCKAPMGAPIRTRTLAVRALNLKCTGLSWAQVANKLCLCQESRHDSKCADRIRTQVRNLKSLFRKYRIAIPDGVEKSR